MNIVIDNIEQFKAFFNVIYDMSSELVELQLYVDRMVCTMLDKTKTRFFHCEYDAKFFDVYSVEDMDSVVIFIEDLYNLLKSCNKTDVLHLEVNESYLIGKIESPNGNSRVFEFVLPMDFVDSPVPPHAEFPTVFKVGVGELKQSAKDISLIGSDLFIFRADEDALNILTDGNIATKYSNRVMVEFEKPINTNVEKSVTSGFTLEYVSQMLKFDKVSKTVKIKLGQDLPIFYTFEDEVMGVRVSGMIAPRTSEDD